jgi:hypothetical protein
MLIIALITMIHAMITLKSCMHAWVHAISIVSLAAALCVEVISSQAAAHSSTTFLS